MLSILDSINFEGPPKEIELEKKPSEASNGFKDGEGTQM
tara:strand:+ start:600 stop:716 length:117 start_codon:yes stop_codon:yes gene_type:complete